MAKRKPKPALFVRASVARRAKAEVLKAKQAALHAALAGMVRRGGESAIGIPISEQDQGVGVVTSHDSGAVMDSPAAVMDGRATKRKKRADLTTKPRFTFPPPTEPAPPPPQPQIGAYRISELREGQCRFACTGHHVAPDQHRFCGARTEIGPGNLHGSWCGEHLPAVFGPGSVGERHAHVLGKRVRLG